MKKATVILLGALAIGACSKDTVGPSDDSLLLDAASNLAFAGSFAGDPSANFLGPVARFPDNLKLTAAQEAQIKALTDAFVQANKADHDALAAIMKQAQAAIDAGKTRDEVRVILEQAAPIRARLQAAEQKLHTDILAVLTADQKAWLEANRPHPCAATALTDDQKNQISALVASFEQANKADFDAVKAALEQAHAAQRSGATRDQVRAILEAARPAMERLAAANEALRTAIKAVLTPAQLTSGCGLPPIGPQLPRMPGR